MTKHEHQKPFRVRDILLLISIPLGLFILLALAVYIPRWTAHPAHDFIYAICSEYRCPEKVRVYDGRVSVEGGFASGNEGREALQLYYYRVSDDSSRPISNAEAATIRVNNESRSTDGYTFESQRTEESFLFWGNSSSGWMLKNGLRKKPVRIVSSIYYDNVRFVGWVEE